MAGIAVIYSVERVKKYFEEKAKAEKKVSALIKKHGVGYKNGSVVDNGKSGWLLPPVINKQIKEIRAEAEKFKPW